MEQWRILEKPNITFNVSNQGNIQVLDGSWKFIKTFTAKDFSLTGGQKTKYHMTHGHYVHRLVAEIWISEIPEGYQVNHIDSNKLNNEVSNLEIVTMFKNMRHARDNGLRDNCKLTTEELEHRQMKYEVHKYNKRWGVYDLNFCLIDSYESIYEAAKSIHVSRQTANNSIRKLRPILKNYYISRLIDVSNFKNKIEQKGDN